MTTTITGLTQATALIHARSNAAGLVTVKQSVKRDGRHNLEFDKETCTKCGLTFERYSDQGKRYTVLCAGLNVCRLKGLSDTCASDPMSDRNREWAV